MKKPELWYSVTVRDRDRKVISREHWKSRSFIRRWCETIYVQVTGNAVDSLIAPNPINLRMLSGFDTWSPDVQSIVVGSSDAPVTVSDTGLASKIAHGSGVGQLTYQPATVNTSIVSTPNCGFVVERAFLNYSGAEITVKESGIYVVVKGITYYTSLCVVRDVLATPQAIPDGGALSISYTLRVTA